MPDLREFRQKEGSAPDTGPQLPERFAWRRWPSIGNGNFFLEFTNAAGDKMIPYIQLIMGDSSNKPQVCAVRTCNIIYVPQELIVFADNTMVGWWTPLNAIDPHSILSIRGTSVTERGEWADWGVDIAADYFENGVMFKLDYQDAGTDGVHHGTAFNNKHVQLWLPIRHGIDFTGDPTVSAVGDQNKLVFDPIS